MIYFDDVEKNKQNPVVLTCFGLLGGLDDEADAGRLSKSGTGFAGFLPLPLPLPLPPLLEEGLLSPPLPAGFFLTWSLDNSDDSSPLWSEAALKAFWAWPLIKDGISSRFKREILKILYRIYIYMCVLNHWLSPSGDLHWYRRSRLRLGSFQSQLMPARKVQVEVVSDPGKRCVM